MQSPDRSFGRRAIPPSPRSRTPHIRGRRPRLFDLPSWVAWAGGPTPNGRYYNYILQQYVFLSMLILVPSSLLLWHANASYKGGPLFFDELFVFGWFNFAYRSLVVIDARVIERTPATRILIRLLSVPFYALLLFFLMVLVERPSITIELIVSLLGALCTIANINVRSQHRYLRQPTASDHTAAGDAPVRQPRLAAVPDPRARAKTIEFCLDLAAAVAVAVVVGCAIAFSLSPMRGFYRQMCPADTLLWGGTDSSYALLIIPLAVVGILYLRRFLRGVAAARIAEVIEVPKIRPALGWAGVGMLAVFPFLMVNAAFSYSCVTPEGITGRASYLAGTTLHPWTDVTTVNGYCVERRRGGVSWGIDLVMRDGAVFRMPGSLDEATRIVVTSLGSQSYDYTLDLEDLCPAEERSALLIPALLAHDPDANSSG